jgi:signal transduction histidine kinase
MPRKFLWTENRSQFLVAGILLLLLPLLAILQYRWLGQLSESEQKQMQASLRAAAVRFSEEFDQEITTAFVAFLPDVYALKTAPVQRLTQAYANWQATTRYPQLIDSVYYVTSGDLEKAQLLRFDLTSQQVDAAAWPPALRSFMQKQLEQFRAAAPLATGNANPFKTMPRPTLLEPGLPALVIPQPELRERMSAFEPLTAASVSFIVVLLSQTYLRQEFLPALLRKQLYPLGDGTQARYLLAVNDGTTTQRIAWSGETATPVPTQADADVSVRFFRLPSDEVRDRMRRRLTALSPADFAALPKRPSNFPPPFSAAPMILPLIGLMSAETEEGLWQLHIRHESGSLAAAVAQVRRRNLLVSSSILLLLAGSVILLMRAAQRARQLAQQQMDFVAGVSHELRTPLTVIDSAAYNLSRGVTRMPEQMQQYGQLIRKQTRQLHEMIEQTLEYAAIQSRQQLYDLQPVQINALLDELLQVNQPLLAERGFQLQADIPDELPAVQADAAALRRALQNLLNNALKYSGDSRWIGLQARCANHSQPAELILSIKDRGLGIAAADLPHIFEPFYRGSEVRAAQIHGNGLGLSLVQNIVHAHGGKLKVESQPNQGSTFSIYLPLARARTETNINASTLASSKVES